MAELVEFCRLRDRWVRTEAGEGAVATGGSDGDLKRMAGYPSVAVMSVLGVAIGKEKKDWAKRAWCWKEWMHRVPVRERKEIEMERSEDRRRRENDDQQRKKAYRHHPPRRTKHARLAQILIAHLP